MSTDAPSPVERRVLTITGLVQGVGFRPHVFRLAAKFGVAGFVRNELGGVRVEVQGPPAALTEFARELVAEAPPLADIAGVKAAPAPPAPETDFKILSSTGGVIREDYVSPDVATCDECLAEVLDPANRRHRYPFTNCTNCGPRLTIIHGLPYDRDRTTMATFTMCPACRAEYENPADRRFHAEPIACPVCGPRLKLLDPQGGQIAVEDPIQWAAGELRSGRIGALKGLGGFHLMCDACDDALVAELRRRKQRDERPFAIMVADLAAARRFCEVTEAEARMLGGPHRPIVLANKRPSCAVAEAVAPGNPLLGILLPYTPLHHLLLRELGGMPLVMTSGNRSDAPIVFEDERLLPELGPIADFFLTHDRPIHSRCDDSVMRISGGRPLPLRRSRGYAPAPIKLAFDCPRPLLALGGQMKTTFALGRGHQAILSHHLGDLDDAEAFAGYELAVEDFERLYDFRPEVLAHDLHPDYASTRFARERARRVGLPLVAVQHHHAHIASCLAEHGLNERVIGVAFDGTGYGPDGAVWGGEFLVADCRAFERAAHFRYLPMPGGEAAIREPWRMALAHLRDTGEVFDNLCKGIPAADVAVLQRMMSNQINSALTSSCGRLFDAVAAMLGIRRTVSYEGQAAIELEWLAARAPADGEYPFAVNRETQPMVVDTRPIIAAVMRDVRTGVEASRIARRFHSTVAAIIVEVCRELRERTGLRRVALSGGVFMNVILLEEASGRLSADGFNVLRHSLVPPNDGGLSLGQLTVAAAGGIAFPLTASAGERGNRPQSLVQGKSAKSTATPNQPANVQSLFPLLSRGGEGQGEGEREKGVD